MTDQPNSDQLPRVDYASPTTGRTTISPFREWTPTDWLWACVLVLSLVIGFGMTAFAPI